MSDILELLKDIIFLVVEAIIAYDATPEGHQHVEAILNDLEAAGVDVPFYEPTNAPDLDLRQQGAEVLNDLAARFAARHPDIARSAQSEGV